MINKITNILGIVLIIAGGYSVFVLEKVTWSDAMFAVYAGIGLIYTKNSSLVKDYLNTLKKEE